MPAELPRPAVDPRSRGARLQLALLAILAILAILAAAGGPSPLAAAPASLAPPSATLDEAELQAAIRAETAAIAATREGQSPAPASIAELRGAIEQVLERERVPGVGLALVDEDGLIWAGGVGVRDLDSRAPVDGDTVFRVASITKSVVAIGAMTLVERGALELDAPLAPLLPEPQWTNAWAEDAPLSLAHMLEHTAGFDDMHFDEFWTPTPMRPREALALNHRSRVVRWSPSSRMSYANPGYTVAGYAIEQASGEAWDRYLMREVLAPLAMDEARFERTAKLRARLATGYLGPEQAASFEPLVHAPAGALLTTPRELARLVEFWLRRGRTPSGAQLLDAASLARIERTETLPYPTPDTNYGLGNYGDVLHPVVARGHDGGLPGFLSCYRYVPELGVGYVMLLNATHSVRAYVEIRRLLFAYLSRGRELPEPPQTDPDPEAVAAALGYYEAANPRYALLGLVERALVGMSVHPSPAGIELELLLGGRAELLATGPDSFRLAHEGGSSLRATTDARGQRILVAGMSYFERGSRTWARARLLGYQAILLSLQLSVLWGLGWVLVALVRRVLGREIDADERRLQLRSLATGASFTAMIVLVQAVFATGAFTGPNPLTLALCASTLALPATTAALLAAVVSTRRGRPQWPRLVPSATALAGLALTLVMLANGLIGLRIWI